MTIHTQPPARVGSTREGHSVFSSSDVAYMALPGARKERAHHRLSLDAHDPGLDTTAYNRTTYTVSGEQPAQPHGAQGTQCLRMCRL